jgi:hypothetical protein
MMGRKGAENELEKKRRKDSNGTKSYLSFVRDAGGDDELEQRFQGLECETENRIGVGLDR